MRRLIAETPRNQDVIFPYIGGEEVNTSPATRPAVRYQLPRLAFAAGCWRVVGEGYRERRAVLRRQAMVPVDYPGRWLRIGRSCWRSSNVALSQHGRI